MIGLEKLNDPVDEFDRDSRIPNIVHVFLTAKRIFLELANKDWIHLTGLIYGLGKIMAIYEVHQWAVVGDTF